MVRTEIGVVSKDEAWETAKKLAEFKGCLATRDDTADDLHLPGWREKEKKSTNYMSRLAE